MINNEFLSNYYSLNAEVNEKSKQLENRKADLKLFIEKREKKSFITAEFMAHFQIQNRTIYDIPKKVKEKYSEIKKYSILKVDKKIV